MEPWKLPEGFYPSAHPGSFPRPSPDDPSCPSRDPPPVPGTNTSHRVEPEVNDSITARKVQKADREKLRRDRLNEQFHELSNALDPDRPKNDKATILSDAVQILKDLTTQVNRLKAEYTSLSEESRELTQEKNELREEKATLKSDIESLNLQYNQRLRAMYPWPTMDPSVMMAAPAYTYAMPMPIPSAPIPLHPSLQPYPFFPNQSSGVVPNPCPAFGNTRVEETPALRVSSHPQHSITKSQSSCLQDSVSKVSDHRQNGAEKGEEFSNVATDLELKTPGSSIPSRSESAQNQESTSARKKTQHCPSGSSSHKGNNAADRDSGTSRFSPSHGLQDSSSNSVGDGYVDEN